MCTETHDTKWLCGHSMPDAVQRWRWTLRPGDCALRVIAEPDPKNALVSYVRIVERAPAHPWDERKPPYCIPGVGYSAHSPQGHYGLYSPDFQAPLTEAQFEAARRAGWPADIRDAAAILWGTQIQQHHSCDDERGAA